MLALEKPSGLLAVPGRGPEKQDCLWRRGCQEYPGLLVVHRLDRDTSGVIVFARTAEAQRRLARQFEERRVSKSYQAIVAGIVAEPEGTVDAPLAKDWQRPPRYLVDAAQGRAAITHWQVIERGADQTRCALRPVTGRSHQLRVHLAWRGHPILGDPLYAPPEIQALAPRLMLHATELCVSHPATGEPLMIRSPAPF